MLCRSCGRILCALRSSGFCCGFWRNCSRQRLHEFVERRAQIVGEAFDLLVAGAALERLAQSILRVPQRLLRVGNVAVLEIDRHVPHARHDLAQRVVVLGLGQLPEDRAQAEIDVGLHVEAIGRQREGVERGEHAGLGLGVERQDAPLLDQGARHRLVERPLRQLQFERFALALLAGFVAGDERHDRGGAGPWMLGQILGGLADTVAGARLRQGQREVGRLEQGTWRRLAGSARGRGPPRP